jgi:hypothetical protein
MNSARPPYNYYILNCGGKYSFTTLVPAEARFFFCRQARRRFAPSRTAPEWRVAFGGWRTAKVFGRSPGPNRVHDAPANPPRSESVG